MLLCRVWVTIRKKFKFTQESVTRSWSWRHSRRAYTTGKRTVDLQRTSKDEKERDYYLTAHSTSLKRSWNDWVWDPEKAGKATSKSLHSQLVSRLRSSQGIARQNLVGHSCEGYAQAVWHTMRGQWVRDGCTGLDRACQERWKNWWILS